MPVFPGVPAAPAIGVVRLVRRIGTVVLDSDVCFIGKAGITFDAKPDHQVDRVAGRFGRRVETRYDWMPLDIEVRGIFLDDYATGRFYGDFKSTLGLQRRVSFDLGNGREYRWVDVVDMMETRNGGVLGVAEAWAFTLKLMSYEPFQRAQAVSYVNLGTSGTLNVIYPGTAFAEPTWAFPVSGGEAFSLRNNSSGELITGTVPSNGAGWVMLDASGAKQGTSPDNMDYGLLPVPATFGYGVTYWNGTAYFDVDFTGRPPTLIPNASPTLPPTPYTNVMAWSGPGSLHVLAPARYLR